MGPKTKLFSKISFTSILNLCTALTSCKKYESFRALTFQNNEKTSFYIHFGLLLAQKLQNIYTNFKSLCCCYFVQNIRKVPSKLAITCSKLTIKIPERRHWRRYVIFIVNFEHSSHLVLVFPLLTLTI